MSSTESSPKPKEKVSSKPAQGKEATDGFRLFGKYDLNELFSREATDFDLLSQLTHMSALSTAGMDRAFEPPLVQKRRAIGPADGKPQEIRAQHPQVSGRRCQRKVKRAVADEHPCWDDDEVFAQRNSNAAEHQQHENGEWAIGR